MVNYLRFPNPIGQVCDFSSRLAFKVRKVFTRQSVLFIGTPKHIFRHYFSSSVQKLYRTLQSRSTNKWCLPRRPWYCRCLWCVLWPNNSRWGVDSVPEKTGRFTWLQSRLEWLQTRLRESKRGVLAWTGKDSPSDERTKQASGGSRRFQRTNIVRWVRLLRRCWQRK